MNSVAFGVLEELFVRIEELPTNQYVWQTYSEIAMGATRIEDKGDVYKRQEDDREEGQRDSWR